MNRSFAFLILIFLSVNVAAQKTEKHINIPGTKLFIIPPEGFEPAENFFGLYKDDSNIIQVYDLDGGDFSSNARNFNERNLKQKGMNVLAFEESAVGDYPAKFARMALKDGFESCQLIFGDSTFSVMIMAAFEVEDKRMRKQIKECLFSAYYDTAHTVDPFATVSFSTEGSTSRFKFHKLAGPMYLYTLDGKTKTDDKTEPFATILVLPSDQFTTPKIIVESLKKGLIDNGFVEKEVIAASHIEINDSNAYERTATGFMNGKPVVVYHCAIKNGDGFVALGCITYTDNENNLEEFKKLARDIRFK